ncbi:MAG: PD40 domain-containing protein [Bacteroidia bacterium]|nr:PD40 domain-containing protein [Bacteroidia bacterium]
MKSHKAGILILFCLSCLIKLSFAQTLDPLGRYDDEYIISFDNALAFISENNYNDALKLFIELEKKAPDNSNIQFHIGLCYLNSSVNKHLAIPYLEKASSNISLEYYGDDWGEIAAPVFTYYFLAKAYHFNYQFDKAIEYFNKFKYYLTIKDKELIDDANHLIAMCYNAKKFTADPVTLQSTNLGKEINSEYPEYAPVVSSDGRTLIFTSRRKGSTGGKIDKDGFPFEDIYFSNYDEKKNKWSKPAPIGSNINTTSHEASVSISYDGTILIIYRADNESGNIYQCKKDGNKWSVAEDIGSDINTRAWETHACFSPDGETLYFVSDRKGGFGGKDIYLCRKNNNGEWSKPENIGPQINTQYDEESPFMLEDGKTLYFSSQGHESMGGYDIFYPPQNIGYPVNTTSDDIFYVPLNDGKEAYYASVKTGGLGNMDIYHVTITDALGPYTTFYGNVIDSITNEGLETVIEIVDNISGTTYASTTSLPPAGEFHFSLPVSGEYNILINDIDYLFYSKLIKTGDNNINREILKLKPAPVSARKILIADKEINVGERIVMDAIHFDSGSSEITDDMHRAISELYFFLFDNPSLKIEISSHSDNSVPEEENIRLTQARAKTIADVLIKGGVDENRIIYKGYGSRQPVASNDSEEGRLKNRRIEYKVVSKYSGEAPFYVISSTRTKYSKPKYNIYYSVQISSSKDSSMSIELKEKYGLNLQVFVHKYVDDYKYSVGKFETYREASEYSRFLREVKNIMSFTIAFRENERISIHEARIITKESGY